VHEHILRAVIGLDKAVALLGIEPLHGSDRHCLPSRNQEIPPAQDERRGQTATLNGEQVRRSIARGKSKPNDEEVDLVQMGIAPSAYKSNPARYEALASASDRPYG
jgi:hypothetical protein